jgi:hypothetical protein
MQVHYMRSAEWEPDWIENAIDIAERNWEAYYKPTAPALPVPGTSQFAYSHVSYQ